MNCTQFRKNIDDLIEGSVNDSLKNDMENHMGLCSSCRKEYEDTKSIIQDLRMDAASIVINEKERKEIKETLLKAPVKKYRDLQRNLRSLAYAAAIFMFLAAGVYFAGGVNINIGASESRDNSLQVQLSNLEDENNKLRTDFEQLMNKNKEMGIYIKDLESGKNKNWMMINSRLGEAIIEGTILSIDRDDKKVRLGIYKDDNTPDIDPNITIPDGIMVTRVPEGPVDKEYKTIPGSIEDLKVSDHITIHYIGPLKSARSIIVYDNGI